MAETDSPQLAAIKRQIRTEMARPDFPEAEQIAYAEKHAAAMQRYSPFAEESDVEIAGRARMLMRDDWTHEGVCVAVRDRICRLVVERRALQAQLREAGLEPVVA